MPLALPSAPFNGGVISKPLLAPNGSLTAKGIAFSSAPNSGLYLGVSSEVILQNASGAKIEIFSSQINFSHSSRFPNGLSTNCGIAFSNDQGTGLYRDAANVLRMSVSNDLTLELDKSATATHVRMLVYDVDSGSMQRVTVGAADSGGAGFKVLRIPN